MISGCHRSDGSVMGDICDGHYYSSHPAFCCNDKALQIFTYYDEFVLTNPLMARKNNYKIGNCL